MLDFQDARALKESQVSRDSQNFYAQWRRGASAVTLREDSDAPPERLLQAIWQHQRLRRNDLRTLDGETLRVLHPGFASAGSGPDFRNAVLQQGNRTAQSGDVEVDLRPNGWRAHGHDRNPAFRKVLLHVVWDGAGARVFKGPTLALRSLLDAPLTELSSWLEHTPDKVLPDGFLGRCAAPLRELPEEHLNELLQQAARVRFEAKAAQLQARARQAGWDQALWEGLFRAAGYQHNVWPMQCLAESRGRWFKEETSAFVLQARLFGLSGLLPTELSRREVSADGYLRRIWDAWWRERDEFSDVVLPREAWRLHGLRPANHPQRRLALAAYWSAAGDLPARVERWSLTPIAVSDLAASLGAVFYVAQDDFWSWHWSFRSVRLPRKQQLLGAARVTDLAINVVLPWLWTRAQEGKNEKLRREIERRHLVWPAAEDNAILRLARQRLLSHSSPKWFRHAAQQQGLMQIVRDFCDHSNAVCDQCGFPQLVRDWTVAGFKKG